MSWAFWPGVPIETGTVPPPIVTVLWMSAGTSYSVNVLVAAVVGSTLIELFAFRCYRGKDDLPLKVHY